MAKAPREVLKQYYQSGDMPTQQQFATTLDSMVNFIDDRDFIGLRTYNPALDYLPGDCAVFNDKVVKCITATTGIFNPADWTVLAAFGSVNYAGTWDTQNNDPPLASSIGSKGFYYVVINASSDPNDNTELNGIDDWGTSDWAIFNGSVWEKVDNSQSPVQASDVSYVPSGNLSATNVQDAIDELELEKQPMLALKNPFIPYARAANKLADSWLFNVDEGIGVILRKIIRSEKAGESQIDFGSGGDEVKLSTAGNTATESRFLMSPKSTFMFAEAIKIAHNDTKSTLLLNGNKELSLSNDGASGSDVELKMSAGNLSLNQAAFGGISVGPGAGSGKTQITGGDNTIQITNDLVSINNNTGAGGLISIDSSGVVEISSDQLLVDSTDVQFTTLSASTVPVVDATQNLVSSVVTPTELEFLSGVTASVQTQLNAKLDLAGGIMTGDLILNADPVALLGAVTKQYADAISTTLSASIATKVSKAGDTMSGPLILDADPVAALGAVTKQYADGIDSALTASIATKVSKAGDSMSGPLVLSADPVAALGAVTKQYADGIDSALTASIATKVSKAGDSMSGPLVLNADPVATLGAVTKQYADGINSALTASVATKVSKVGDTMSGPLVLNADPSSALGAATKQYVDAATKKLLIPFTFDNDYITNSASFTGIPLQITVPDAATVFPGATTITAKLSIDYLTENGATPAQGEAGLTEWTTATSASPSLISGSAIPMAATLDVWTKATSTTAFAITGNRSYRVIFRKTAGSAGARIRIESASLTLFYS